MISEERKARNKKRMRIKMVKFLTNRILVYSAVIIVAVAVLSPYLWMVSGSFKSTRELQTADCTIPDQEPTWIPRDFSWDNYININETVPMLGYFVNSMITSTGTMVFSIIISMFAAYGMSRVRFSFKKTYEMSLYATQMFPGIAFLIPFFLIFIFVGRTLNIQLIDTFKGLILTYTSFALPFSILMLRNYISSIPIEIDEQARIDGCTRAQVIFRIIFPLALPGIVSVGIFSFIMAWSEILFASIITRGNTKPVSIGLMDYITTFQTNWGGMMAACIVISIPILIFFTFLQKYIISGMTEGATKG